MYLNYFGFVCLQTLIKDSISYEQSNYVIGNITCYVLSIVFIREHKSSYLYAISTYLNPGVQFLNFQYDLQNKYLRAVNFKCILKVFDFKKLQLDIFRCVFSLLFLKGIRARKEAARN